MERQSTPTDKGRQSSEGLHEAASEEEQKIEAEKGSPLKKGADRFDERSRSSDGQSAGEKQQ